jgi:hypothetical protein
MTKKSKIILIATVIFAAGAAIAVPVAIHHYNSEPNFAKMNPQEIRQYFDSNQFRDANEEAKRKIRDQMFGAMQARTLQQANGYIAQPEETRTAYLDNIIDEMQARRAEFMNGRDPNRMGGFARQGANAGQRRVNPQQMRERTGPMASMSAQDRVNMMQFQRAMRDRMDQRGIQGPMGRGGFGGPGGGGFGGPGGGGFGGPGGGRGGGPPGQ